MTKDELKNQFYDGRIVNGALMGVLIDNLKGVQSPVIDQQASGTSVTFIAAITQDAEGKITVTKKSVNFSGYLPSTALDNYQEFDRQRVGEVKAAAGEQEVITHNMKHYPTVRLIDSGGTEIDPSKYMVKHYNTEELSLELGGELTGMYKYILD